MRDKIIIIWILFVVFTLITVFVVRAVSNSHITLKAQPNFTSYTSPGCWVVSIFPIPFARWESNCQGGWVLTFRGNILWGNK